MFSLGDKCYNEQVWLVYPIHDSDCPAETSGGAVCVLQLLAGNIGVLLMSDNY